MKRFLDYTELTIGVPAKARGRAGLVLAASLLLSACSSLPEWTDPGGWFSEETPAPSKISAAKDLEQAKSGDFPNLASVPDPSRRATGKDERAAIAKSLTADRANAQYSSERLVAKGTGTPKAPAAPAIAQGLGAAAPQAPPPTPAPVPAPALVSSATSIAPAPVPVPAPVPAPALPSPARAKTEIAKPAPSVQSAAKPAVTAPPARPRTSELAGIIYFAHGSDALNANDRNVLRDIVALSQERNARIRVIGHASARTGTVDAVAHRIANLEASQRRAEAVTAALVGMGARRGRILTEARADSLPVYHEFMPTGEAGNRRAEIFLEY